MYYFQGRKMVGIDGVVMGVGDGEDLGRDEGGETVI